MDKSLNRIILESDFYNVEQIYFDGEKQIWGVVYSDSRPDGKFHSFYEMSNYLNNEGRLVNVNNFFCNE